MKSLIYFCFVIFMSTLTSFYIAKPFPEKEPSLKVESYQTAELKVLKQKTKNLLSKFVYNQKLILMDIQSTQENINFIKSKKTLNTKKYEFYNQHYGRYIVEGN